MKKFWYYVLSLVALAGISALVYCGVNHLGLATIPYWQVAVIVVICDLLSDLLLILICKILKINFWLF